MRITGIILIAFIMIVLVPVDSFAFSTFGISNQNTVGATVSGYTDISISWRYLAIPSAIMDSCEFTPMGTRPGTPIDVTQQTDLNGTAFLRVVIDTNEYSDYGGRIYLRNWDQTAERHMTTDPNETPQLKGLIHEDGEEVIPIKWTAMVPGGYNGPQHRVIYRNSYENTDYWHWFLDPTYGEDSDFFTNQDKLNYATFITSDQIEFFQNPAADIYFIGRSPALMLAGDYRTTTITVEVYYE